MLFFRHSSRFIFAFTLNPLFKGRPVTTLGENKRKSHLFASDYMLLHCHLPPYKRKFLNLLSTYLNFSHKISKCMNDIFLQIFQVREKGDSGKTLRWFKTLQYLGQIQGMITLEILGQPKFCYVSFRICLKLESQLDCWFKLKQNHILTPLCIKLDSQGYSHSSLTLCSFRFTIDAS